MDETLKLPLYNKVKGSKVGTSNWESYVNPRELFAD